MTVSALQDWSHQNACKNIGALKTPTWLISNKSVPRWLTRWRVKEHKSLAKILQKQLNEQNKIILAWTFRWIPYNGPTYGTLNWEQMQNLFRIVDTCVVSPWCVISSDVSNYWETSSAIPCYILYIPGWSLHTGSKNFPSISDLQHN